MKNAILTLMTLGFAGALYAGSACCPVADAAKDGEKKVAAAEAKKYCGEACKNAKKDCATECKADAKAVTTEKPATDAKVVVVIEEAKAE